MESQNAVVATSRSEPLTTHPHVSRLQVYKFGGLLADPGSRSLLFSKMSLFFKRGLTTMSSLKNARKVICIGRNYA